jgi:hypothetical protein
MAELEIKYNQKTNDYESAYRLGLGYFNTSHEGRWWILVDDSWSWNDTPKDLPGLATRLHKAREYFRKTTATKDPELRARAIFMLAQTYLDESALGYNEEVPPELKKNYGELANIYKNTEFVREELEDCAGFQSYRKKGKL